MIFGDQKVLAASTTQTDSFIVAIDGKTGAEKGKEVAVPQDLKSTGNVTGHFSSAYFDGVHPSLYYKGKAGGTAAMMDMGFDFKDGAWSLRFKAVRSPIKDFPNNHNIRCVDLNQDGKDECINGGYAIDGTGTVLWNMGSQGVVHGDRWHVGDLDPSRPGLEGVAIEQNGPSFDAYEYDAKDGTVLHKWGNAGGDLARGTTGDIDPTHKGYEFWGGGSLGIVSTVDFSKISGSNPPMNFRIWWDGDVLSENLDDVTISKWAYPGMPSGGFTSKKLEGKSSWRQAVPLYGDMFGDWREEVLLENTAGTAIRIYTTTIPTEKRIYTLMHDPEYRNSMNEKGYQQSRMVDYYLGDGMTDPPKPNITYPGGTVTPPAGGSGGGATTGAAGAGGGATTAAGGASGGRGGGTGGTTGPGVTTVADTGGTEVVGSGGTSALGGKPATGGTPAIGGSAAQDTGGAVAAGTGGTTGAAPTGGNPAGGATDTGPKTTAAESGCSCAIGATSGGVSAGYFIAMLGGLFLVVGRRRRRTGPRD
jgi:MYXO-CTERM domain-containing protein